MCTRNAFHYIFCRKRKKWFHRKWIWFGGTSVASGVYRRYRNVLRLPRQIMIWFFVIYCIFGILWTETRQSVAHYVMVAIGAMPYYTCTRRHTTLCVDFVCAHSVISYSEIDRSTSARKEFQLSFILQWNFPHSSGIFIGAFVCFQSAARPCILFLFLFSIFVSIANHLHADDKETNHLISFPFWASPVHADDDHWSSIF